MGTLDLMVNVENGKIGDKRVLVKTTVSVHSAPLDMPAETPVSQTVGFTSQTVGFTSQNSGFY